MLLRSISVVFVFLFFLSNLWADAADVAAMAGIEKVAPNLRDKLQRASVDQLKGKYQTYRLIVRLRPRESPAESARAFANKAWNKRMKENIRHLQKDVLDTMTDVPDSSFKVLARYNSLYGFSALADLEGLSRLAAHDQVIRIEEMPLYQKMDDEAFALTETTLAHAAGWTGNGVTVAIIDDGIDYSHTAFGGFQGFPNARIIGGYDFADYDEDPGYDCAGQSHGTAVAGVAVGNGGGVMGTAPEANLVFLKVQKTATCGQPLLDGDIIAALDWVITHRNTYGIKVISMSFGSDQTYADPCSQSIAADALTAAANAGLIVVVASGNSAAANGISDPACSPDAFSVGAVYDTNLGYAGFRNCTDAETHADMVTCYSNSAYFLDVLAPSHCATTAQAGGGVNSCFGGTSSAAPYVAGIAATLFEKNPSLGRSAAAAALVNDGDLVSDSRNGLTKPRVNHVETLNGISGNGVGALSNNSPLSGLAGDQGENTVFALSVPAGAGDLQIESFGGSGNIDLYVRYNVNPTLSVYDCGSMNPGNDESCTVANPNSGTYYILVHGVTAYSEVNLQASYIEPGVNSVPRVLRNGVPVTGLSGAEMTNSYFSLSVPPGSTNLKITISGGSGDADLHVKNGLGSSGTAYDCRPLLPGNNEECSTEVPGPGNYQITINAHTSYSGLSLVGTFDLPEKFPAIAPPLFLLLGKK